MTRPDPHATSKRPMAAAQRAINYRPASAGEGRRLLAPNGSLDLAAVHAALERSDAAAEGGRYADPQPTFAGSVVFDVQAPDAHAALPAARFPRSPPPPFSRSPSASGPAKLGTAG